MSFISTIKMKYLDKKLELAKKTQEHREQKMREEIALLRKQKEIREAGKVKLTPQEKRVLEQEKQRHKKAIEERNRKIKENTEKLKKLGEGFMKVVDKFDDSPRKRTKPKPTKRKSKSRRGRA